MPSAFTLPGKGGVEPCSVTSGSSFHVAVGTVGADSAPSRGRQRAFPVSAHVVLVQQLTWPDGNGASDQTLCADPRPGVFGGGASPGRGDSGRLSLLEGGRGSRGRPRGQPGARGTGARRAVKAGATWGVEDGVRRGLGNFVNTACGAS